MPKLPDTLQNLISELDQAIARNPPLAQGLALANQFATDLLTSPVQALAIPGALGRTTVKKAQGNVEPGFMNLLGDFGQSFQDTMRQDIPLLGQPAANLIGRADQLAKSSGLSVGQQIAGGFGVPDLGDIGTIARQADNLNDVLFGMVPGMFHGTGSKPFKEFDPKFIGSGEGAAAFGHGFYFSQNPKVANSYKPIINRQVVLKEGFNPDLLEVEDVAMLEHLRDGASVVSASGTGLTVPSLVRRAIEREKQITKKALDEIETANLSETLRAAEINIHKNLEADRISRLKYLEQNIEIPDHPGSLMEVDIDIEFDDMLDWDKPFDKQAPSVQQKLRELDTKLQGEGGGLGLSDQTSHVEVAGGTSTGLPKGRDIYDRLVGRLGSKSELKSSALKPEASKLLAEAGIPGIKFLDQASRAKGEGTSNLVVFPSEVKRIQIKKINDLPVEEVIKQSPEPNLVNAEKPKASSGALTVNQPAVLKTAQAAGLSVFPKIKALPDEILSQFIGKRSDDLVALHEATLKGSKITPEALAAIKVRLQRGMDDEIGALELVSPERLANAKAAGLINEFGRHNIKLPAKIPEHLREAADKIADAKILKARDIQNMRKRQAEAKRALDAGNLANPK